MRKNLTFHRYLMGLGATFAGAWLTDLTSSMIPLALGASLAIILTAPLVRRIWTAKRNEKGTDSVG